MAGYRIPVAGLSTSDVRSVRPVRELSPEQIAAIRAVMRIFVEDDRERGVTAGATLHCMTCARSRPAAGAISYGDVALCNRCALDYELSRACGGVRNATEYLDLRAGTAGIVKASAR